MKDLADLQNHSLINWKQTLAMNCVELYKIETWSEDVVRHWPDNAGVFESSNLTSDSFNSNITTVASVQISTVTVVTLE